MKKFIKAIVLSGFTLAFTAGTAFAQFTIDEFGISPSNSVPNLPSFLGPDPSGGVAGPVLIYVLPFGVTPGDLFLTEPGSPAGGGTNSDLVRFWNPTGSSSQSEIIFYSDVSPLDPPDSPADVGLPLQFQSLTVTLPEVGPEGNNGVNYLANPGMPGSAPSGPVQYNIISDSAPVPEPGTGTLLLGGTGLLFGIMRFRRKGLFPDDSLKA